MSFEIKLHTYRGVGGGGQQQRCEQAERKFERTLHLSLEVDNHACIVLKLKELPVDPTPLLPLANDDARHDCFR